MLKLPYGRSDFASLIEDGFHYVDRTRYIAELEQLGETYLVFLRPRRFGKSLWLSTLNYYYGKQYTDKFDTLFGQLTIGRQPTKLANSYLILHLDFSGISTISRDSTYQDFLKKIKAGISRFAQNYPDLISGEVLEKLLKEAVPHALMDDFLTALTGCSYKIYLLIDEYDHFTNELVSFDISQFQDIVSKQGWVRKFYEVVKTGTGQGLIDRIFMTGVSPVTLDGLTSGFNISKDLTRNRRFESMMGFTDAEVGNLLQKIGLPNRETHQLLRDWYNGYRFSNAHAERMYNPDMVLYFGTEYISQGQMPENLLDTNIVSDYGKIKQVFRLGGETSQHFRVLKQVLMEGTITTHIVPQFSFERYFTAEDFLSMLFYLGLLTIKDKNLQLAVLGIPNLVIEKLYFDFFRELIESKLEERGFEINIQEAVYTLAENNQPLPLLELVTDTLKQISNRDLIHFNETGLKMVLLSYLHMAQLYTLRSEHEAERGYVDLLLLRQPAIETPYQFAFELKYLKQKDASKLAKVTEEGRIQLRRYLSAPELQSQPNLRAWLVICIGTEIKVIEEVFQEA
ncbi:MAG: AAA family ATPase [Bacteroidota bacterium]